MTFVGLRDPSLFRMPVLLLSGAALLLAGCALDPVSDESAAKRSATLVGIASPTVPAADFVRESRTAAPQTYIPVGVTPPARPVAPRNAADAASLEAELDAQRNRSQGFARRPAPKASYDGRIPPRPAPPPKELIPE